MYGSETFVISDYDMTNQNFSLQATKKFVKSFSNNRLNENNIEIIVRHCYIYKLHPVFVLTKMQIESDLLVGSSPYTNVTWLKNRAMGYGLRKKVKETEMGIKNGAWFYIYGGFDLQVYFACKLLRESFDSWKPKMKKEVIDLKKWVIPDNAGTYANYVYTPFYGKHNEYGWKVAPIGIKIFETIYPTFKDKWNEINKDYKY